MTNKTAKLTKLTATQEAILKAAASRPDGNIEPLPDNVTPGVRQRVIDGMLSRALVTRFPGGVHRISSYGYESVGIAPPTEGEKAIDAALAKTRPGHQAGDAARAPVARRGRHDRGAGRSYRLATTHCARHHEPHAEEATRANDYVREGRGWIAAVSDRIASLCTPDTAA